MPTSRRSGKRRDVPESVTNQRRDVGYQRRNVTENSNNQRRDVRISRRDVLGLQINVVATFQRHSKSTSRRSNLTSQRSREW